MNKCWQFLKIVERKLNSYKFWRLVNFRFSYSKSLIFRFFIFHGFLSGEKFVNFLRLFLKCQKNSKSKETLQSVFSLKQIYFVFDVFTLKKNPTKVCLTVYSNSHQAFIPKSTSNNLFQISTPFLFMGISLEKNEKFQNLFETFLHAPKELSNTIKSIKSFFNLKQILGM